MHDPGGFSGTPKPPYGTWATSQASLLAGMCAGNHAWPEVRDPSPMARARPEPSVGARWKGCRRDSSHHCPGEDGVGEVRPMTGMEQAQAAPVVSSGAGGVTPPGVELRHLRYFVAVADAGTLRMRPSGCSSRSRH